MTDTMNHIEDFMDAERRLIEVETSEHLAERELTTLFELGEFSRIEMICSEFLEKLPK